MKQINSKLNIYVSEAGITNTDLGRIAFRFILFSFAALSVFYILILGNMVRNIIERKSLEMHARALSSEVGDLELTYLSLSNNIDLPFSYSLGFKEIKAGFATRKTLGFKPIDSVKIAQNGI